MNPTEKHAELTWREKYATVSADRTLLINRLLGFVKSMENDIEYGTMPGVRLQTRQHWAARLKQLLPVPADTTQGETDDMAKVNQPKPIDILELDQDWTVMRRFGCGHVQHACCPIHLSPQCPICQPPPEFEPIDHQITTTTD